MNSNIEDGQLAGSALQLHEITCPKIGLVRAYIQGHRSSHEVVILTVADLGCDPTMYVDFTNHPRMRPIRDRTVWIHITAPGQGLDVPDLPADYQYPRMKEIGEDLVHVLDHLNVKQVVCFGEAAGANILARFAMAHITRVLGIVMLHATGTAAGLQESLKEKMINWHLEDVGPSLAAEQYLVLHRFGSRFHGASNKEQSKQLIESFKESLRNRTNMKNVKQFVESFIKRASLSETIKNLTCPVLLMTGQGSLFYNTTNLLHQLILKACPDKSKVDLVVVPGVANVLEEKPDKLAECFQYFLQGLGLISSVPMHSVVESTARGGGVGRRMSMEDYDKPTRDRRVSSGCTHPDSARFDRDQPGSPVSPPATKEHVGTAVDGN